MNKINLSQIKKSGYGVSRNNSGTTESKFGKIEQNILMYKDKFYKIRYVENDGTLILDTNKLFGKYGDEFSIQFVR